MMTSQAPLKSAASKASSSLISTSSHVKMVVLFCHLPDGKNHRHSVVITIG